MEPRAAGPAGGASAAMCVSRSSPDPDPDPGQGPGPFSKLGNEPDISLVTLGVFVILNWVLNTWNLEEIAIFVT